jgi:hypothetical protein
MMMILVLLFCDLHMQSQQLECLECGQMRFWVLFIAKEKETAQASKAES